MHSDWILGNDSGRKSHVKITSMRMPRAIVRLVKMRVPLSREESRSRSWVSIVVDCWLVFRSEGCERLVEIRSVEQRQRPRAKSLAGWTSCQAGDGAAACESARRPHSVSHRRSLSPLVAGPVSRPGLLSKKVPRLSRKPLPRTIARRNFSTSSFSRTLNKRVSWHNSSCSASCNETQRALIQHRLLIEMNYDFKFILNGWINSYNFFNNS